MKIKLSQDIKITFHVTIVILFLLFIQRGFFLTTVVKKQLQIQDWNLLTNCLWVGFRFDLMVWGFLLLPFVIARFFMIEPSSQNIIFQKIFKIYLLVVGHLWFFILALDLPHFLLHGQRIFRNELDLDSFSVNLSIVPKDFLLPNMIVIFILLAIFIYFSLLIFAKNKTQKTFINHIIDRPRTYFILNNLLLLLAVVFACRGGTFAPHHLRREDSFISKFNYLNETALTPAWTFSKLAP
jgi:hypothetical protein